MPLDQAASWCSLGPGYMTHLSTADKASRPQRRSPAFSFFFVALGRSTLCRCPGHPFPASRWAPPPRPANAFRLWRARLARLSAPFPFAVLGRSDLRRLFGPAPFSGSAWPCPEGRKPPQARTQQKNQKLLGRFEKAFWLASFSWRWAPGPSPLFGPTPLKCRCFALPGICCPSFPAFAFLAFSCFFIGFWLPGPLPLWGQTPLRRRRFASPAIFVRPLFCFLICSIVFFVCCFGRPGLRRFWGQPLSRAAPGLPRAAKKLPRARTPKKTNQKLLGRLENCFG